jgi:hypothetical protein
VKNVVDESEDGLNDFFESHSTGVAEGLASLLECSEILVE